MTKKHNGWALAFAALLLLGAASGARADIAGELGLVTQDRPDNQLQVRQLHTDATQVAAEGTTHQNLICWQVMHGSWNGQSLDGLSLVLVRQHSDVSGAMTSDRCIYISDNATSAQRDALVAAVIALNPSRFPDIKAIRIEPASIEIEQTDGTTVVIHLARIA